MLRLGFIVLGFLLLISSPNISFSQVNSTSVQEYLDAHVANNTFSGTVLIRQNGVTEQWFAGYASHENELPFNEKTQFRYGSISKPLTSTLVFLLQDEGKLSIDDTVSKWLPDYPNGEKITLGHLLTHRSGIPNFTSFPDYMETMHLPATRSEILERFQNLSLNFEPDTSFEYSNSGYILMSVIIEKVTGLSFADALENYITEPIGLNISYENPGQTFPNLASGYTYDGGIKPALPIHMSIPLGGGGIMGDAASLITFVDKLHDTSFISEESRNTMFTPASGNYGYGWGLGPFFDKPSFGHSGGINGFATNFIHVSIDSLTIVVLSNLETAMIGPITRDIGAIVYGKQYEIPVKRQSVEVAPEVLLNYEGVYELVPGFEIKITASGNRLFAQATNQPQFELFAQSETSFFLKVVDARVEFTTDDDGVATSLTLFQGGQIMPGRKL